MSSAPNKFFVPTLDIDLAWQYVGASHSQFTSRGLNVPPSTHQLYPERYSRDCLKHAKRFIDQSVSSRCRLGRKLTDYSHSDDHVEELQLSNSFDSTCRAWEVRQGCFRGWNFHKYNFTPGAIRGSILVLSEYQGRPRIHKLPEGSWTSVRWYGSTLSWTRARVGRRDQLWMWRWVWRRLRWRLWQWVR